MYKFTKLSTGVDRIAENDADVEETTIQASDETNKAVEVKYVEVEVEEEEVDEQEIFTVVEEMPLFPMSSW